MLPRFGIRTGLRSKQPGEKRIWVHALSVGEVRSSVPFITALKNRCRDLDIVFTASTKTGFDMVEKLFLRQVDLKNDIRMVDQLGYFPFDLGLSIQSIRRKIAPDAVVIVETDLWPNFIYEMKKNKIPVLLINARLSNRSLNGYLVFKSFFSLFFSSLTGIMAQTALDKERFERLGIEEKKIAVTGNIKFDQAPQNIDKGMIEDMKDRLGIQQKTKVFIAGSTHEGEEKILLRVYVKIKKNFPDLLMIIAPRDPKRCAAIQSYFLSHGVGSIFFSGRKPSGADPAIVLVDKMGELSRLYVVCDVAFIGGSMVRQGGHNPLEPAVFSKPVLFGSDMSDFALISSWLMDKGGAKTVDSEEKLTTELEFLLKNKQARLEMGRQNHEIFSKNSGAVQRIITHMGRLNIV